MTLPLCKTECDLHDEWAFFTGEIQIKDGHLYGTYACPYCKPEFSSSGFSVWSPAEDEKILLTWLKTDFFDLKKYPDLSLEYRAGLKNCPTNAHGEIHMTISSDGQVRIESWRGEDHKESSGTIPQDHFCQILEHIRRTSIEKLKLPATLSPDVSVVNLCVYSKQNSLRFQILESDAMQIPELKNALFELQALTKKINPQI